MPTQTSDAKDRLLLAAAELLDASGDGTASTRAICELAGVRAPTLYHHFGSKQGLVDEVINHGFTQYLTPPDASGDPLRDLRHGWDQHVRFGCEHPTFYSLLYGRVEPGKPCAVTAPAKARLRTLLTTAARLGLLRTATDDATNEILAANVGVTLSLITQPEHERDMGLSDRVREAVLGSVLDERTAAETPSRAGAALTLRALVEEDRDGLTPGEHMLLCELLDRLAR